MTHVSELEVSKLLKSRSKSVHSSEPLFAQAQVDAVGQLDTELSFQAGDIITVTEVIDEDWYQGECRGKSGMFLAACVQLLNEDECNASPTVEGNHSSVQTSSKDVKTPIKSDSLSHNFQSNVSNHNASSYTKISHDKPVDTGVSYTSENTKAHNDNDTGVTPYARTLYSFVGELADELSFNANDIVTLIQHVDEQWIEGEIDGKIGLLPANYVEIVVDCPYAYSNKEESTAGETSAGGPDVKQSGNHVENKVNVAEDVKAVAGKGKEITNEIHDSEEHYGLVLYDFLAETEQDLTVKEGDTVTVIKQIDDNWLLVRNDSGATGMCPEAFVDIIGAPPELPTTSHDRNYNEIKTEETTSEINSRPAEGGKYLEERNKNVVSKPPVADINKFQSISTKKSSSNAKPLLKPKPLLAPKPVLKPKPSLSPKPWTTSSSHKPVTCDQNSSIPKSVSSNTLSQSAEVIDPALKNGAMTKAQSMFEINNQSDEKLLHETSHLESEGRNQGSLDSLPTESNNTSSTDLQTESKKAFENWDLTKPLDSLLQSEFARAKEEADIKSRGSSFRSSGSSGHSQKSIHDSDIKGVDETDFVAYSPSYSKGNYSRANFDEGLSFGNSTFFVSENKIEQKRGPHLRKPPPTPGRGNTKDADFTRRPSLKKPAPPRPVGPKIAPAPSKVPLVPTSAVPTKTLPSRPAPAQPGSVPTRPQGGPRRHTRPAPPRPEAIPNKPPGEDLIGFSPTNSSVCKCANNLSLYYVMYSCMIQ